MENDETQKELNLLTNEHLQPDNSKTIFNVTCDQKLNSEYIRMQDFIVHILTR